MSQHIVPIGAFDLALATLLVVLAGLVSAVLRLRLERRLLLASTRTVVQLLLVGHVLSWVFRIDHPLVLVLVLVLMIGAAGRAAISRPSRAVSGAYPMALLTLTLTGLLTTFSATSLIIGVEPWYRPQYVIPLLGMVLGNTLTGLSLAADDLLRALDEERGRIEADLALGATRWEAARGPVADAVRRGMIPIINTMMVVGIVSLPGMMTGQILAGADPIDAVKYQIMIMFMIAASCALGSMLMALLLYRRLFNERHQLRGELIEQRST